MRLSITPDNDDNGRDNGSPQTNEIMNLSTN